MQDFIFKEKRIMRFECHRKNTQKKYFFLSDKKNISIFSEKSWFRKNIKKNLVINWNFVFFQIFILNQQKNGKQKNKHPTHPKDGTP